jgi:mono/diheme cytochrome c family protein
MRVLRIVVLGVPALPAAEPVAFARHGRPILAGRCHSCHGPKKQEGGLRPDARRRATVGGDSGPAGGPRVAVARGL